MKYTHRISVPAFISFDVESDNETPTREEVDSRIGWMIDGADVSDDLFGVTHEGTRAYIPVLSFDMDGDGYLLREFQVDNTDEKEASHA